MQVGIFVNPKSIAMYEDLIFYFIAGGITTIFLLSLHNGKSYNEKR